MRYEIENWVYIYYLGFFVENFFFYEHELWNENLTDLNFIQKEIMNNIEKRE